MHSLKGLCDMHVQGFLHRDLKEQNMGLLSEQQPVAMWFDLGMGRMYTDAEGEVSHVGWK